MRKIEDLNKEMDRSSLVMVQWLGLAAFIVVAQVRSLVQELRPHEPLSIAKKKKKGKKWRVFMSRGFSPIPNCQGFSVYTMNLILKLNKNARNQNIQNNFKKEQS